MLATQENDGEKGQTTSWQSEWMLSPLPAGPRATLRLYIQMKFRVNKKTAKTVKDLVLRLCFQVRSLITAPRILVVMNSCSPRVGLSRPRLVHVTQGILVA
jgi:hypothetical protein